MNDFPSTIVIRHPKERLSKCSLHGLESRDDFVFCCFSRDPVPSVVSTIRLEVGAPSLTRADAASGLLVLDGTWRLVERMSRALSQELTLSEPRSIPQNFVTAYPRAQTACPDPDRGLASIEAIYVAYRLLGRSTDGLLDGYRWAQEFLEANEVAFADLV